MNSWKRRSSKNRIQKYHRDIKPLKIPVNVYEVPKHNKILLARLQLDSIHKTNLFNTKGTRIYDFQTINHAGIFDAPAILKHEEKKQI